MSFAECAARLAGQAAIMGGWRPDEFWRATPSELHAIIAALLPPEADPLGRDAFDRLKGQFPDG